MYVVYLFAADMSVVCLTLAQGITDLTNTYGVRGAREKLQAQAAAVRAALDSDTISELDTTIDLRSSLERPRSYEASTIVAKTYDARALPDEDTLAADLRAFLRLYQDALAQREDLRAQPASPIVTPRPMTTKPPAVLEFKPKNDSDYVQTVAARRMVKTRKHETLVSAYGRHLTEQGFRVGTNVHPRDMIAERGTQHWLVEAKVVYRGDGVAATRDALSQLLMYRYSLYPPDAAVGLVAAFNEPVGEFCSAFLVRHQVVPIWYSAGTWVGSDEGLSPPIVSVSAARSRPSSSGARASCEPHRLTARMPAILLAQLKSSRRP